ncbi:UNVERIFIED_CONTAM: Abscisic acid 8'-hydroxylase [Sesamum latifolium]|uniref:Abscisic acid 8'-hydroxylase n=1 Tax=Sesamum latifolium TaxID=2727402 RepID=A0AAW2VTB9_9LAMI
MLASPEAARFVLITQAHLFKPTYPKSKENLIGPRALFFHQGEYHMRLRKLVQGSLYPDSIRRLVADIEETNSFCIGFLKNYVIVDRGYNSFPTSLPGTRYQKAIKARKRLSKILSSITRERRERKSALEKDLLSCLLNSKDDKGETLSEDQIADNIIGVLFAAQDTTASAMTWVLKYLHDNPKLLEAVKAEQKVIYQSNGSGKSHLAWNQTRNMPITHKVILESLRMASIISFTFREAVTDVEYKGYLIPKGWKVMPLFRNIHHNPDSFLTLKDLIRQDSRYELVGSESGIQYGPFPVPLHGLPARFWKEESAK